MLTERDACRVSSASVGGTVAAWRISLQDMAAGVMRWPLWVILAWRDIRQRYMRTVLGPFWLTLSSAIFLIALSIIYSTLLNQDIRSYLPYITASFLPWILFSAVVNESCSTFTSEKGTISNWQFPYSIFVYRLIFRNTIVFFHNFLILVVMYLVFSLTPSWNLLWLPISLVLLWMNAFWISLLLGTLCARFRDVQPIVASVLQITMFVTPIFWKPEMFGSHRARAVFVDGNFIYHMITVIREPLLGRPPPLESLLVCLVVAIVGIAVASALYGRFRHRLPFWM